MDERTRKALIIALGQMMSNVSENCWCAGWLVDLEEELPILCEKALKTKQPQRFGRDHITVGDAEIITALVDLLGHWVILDSGSGRQGYKPYTPQNGYAPQR